MIAKTDQQELAFLLKHRFHFEAADLSSAPHFKVKSYRSVGC